MDSHELGKWSPHHHTIIPPPAVAQRSAGPLRARMWHKCGNVMLGAGAGVNTVSSHRHSDGGEVKM